jgi:hypothetical protein
VYSLNFTHHYNNGKIRKIVLNYINTFCIITRKVLCIPILSNANGKTMITLSTLKYLATRFSQIDGEELAKATELVHKAQDFVATFERNTLAEHALFHTLWGHVTRSLDHSNFSSEHSDAVEALEAEMAGRTLFIRLSLGWVTRSATGPIEFPALEEFIGK